MPSLTVLVQGTPWSQTFIVTERTLQMDLVSKCSNPPGGPVGLLSEKRANKFLPN